MAYSTTQISTVPGWYAVGFKIKVTAGIPSAGAVGTPTLAYTQRITPTAGVPSGEAVGIPTVNRGPVTLVPTGIPSSEAVGNPTIIPGKFTVFPTGVVSSEAFGTLTIVPGPVNISPIGITSKEAVNAPVVTPLWSINLDGGTVTDNFNRANSTSTAGPGWTNQAATLGIIGNAAYSSTPNAWCSATNNTSINTNDAEASITLGSSLGGTNLAGVFLGANAAGQCATALTDGPNCYVYTQTGWAYAGGASQVSVPVSTNTGDVLTLRRVGSLYTVLLNGAPIGLSWNDTGNLIPRDAAHHLTGVNAYNNGSDYRPIDSFSAAGIGGVVSAEAVGTPGITVGPVNVAPTGVASGEAVGTPTVVPGPVNIAVTAGVLSGEAMGTPTVPPPAAPFTPYTETDTPRTNQAVPTASTFVGIRATIIGGGGAGGSGASSGSYGTGGGGAGLVKVFIPKANLGPNYSNALGAAGSAGALGVAGNPGGASTFSSGGVSLSAGGGGGGPVLATSTGGPGAGAGGAGGTVSTTGIATAVATPGGAGSAASGGTGQAGIDSIRAGGGGGSGAHYNSGAKNGGAGGDTQTVTGAAGGISATPNGGSPASAAAGNAGAGGGGGFGALSTGSNGNGGIGGNFGGGGGGGAVNKLGAAGGVGTTILEFLDTVPTSIVEFDSLGAGLADNANVYNWAHTINGNCALVMADTWGASSATAKVGATNMTLLGSIVYEPSFPLYGYVCTLWIFGLMNPPKGAQTVNLTCVGNTYGSVCSMSYFNVGSFGTVQSNTGTGASVSQTVTGAVNQRIAQQFAENIAGGSFGSYNRTSRKNFAYGGSLNGPHLIGDAVGAASVAFTATHSTAGSANKYGSIAVPLNPV